MDHPEICGKHKFNEARARTKDAIDQQTRFPNTCDVTDLIPNWTFLTKSMITTEIKEMSCFSGTVSWRKEAGSYIANNLQSTL